MQATGIILAGGKSSRMGEDKGLVLLNGKPMIQYVIEALKEVVSDIIIISNNASYNKFRIPVYADLIKDKGPVGGIYTGLYHSTTELNFCISCDVPMISSDFILWLLNKKWKRIHNTSDVQRQNTPNDWRLFKTSFIKF